MVTKEISSTRNMNIHVLRNKIYLRYDDKLSCNEKGVTC